MQNYEGEFEIRIQTETLPILVGNCNSGILIIISPFYMENKQSGDDQQRQQSISSELFGRKSEFTKILFTLRQVIVNVSEVLNDFIDNKGKYTRPVKYALAITAPYLIIIALFDLDVAGYIMQSAGQTDLSQYKGDPDALKFVQRYQEVSMFSNKLTFEFLPVYYAIIYCPVMAFWLRIFFRRKELAFSYYYALGIYLQLTATVFTFILFLFSITGILTFNTYFLVALTFSVLFAGYGIYRTFHGNGIVSLVKTILTYFLTFLSVTIPMIVILMIITVATM